MARAARSGVKLGSTSLRNLKFFDPIKGTSVAVDAPNEDTKYRTGDQFKDNLNDCNSFSKRLAAKLDLEMFEKALDHIKASDLYQTRPGFLGTGESQIKAALYFEKSGNPVDGAKVQSELVADTDSVKSLALSADQLTLVDSNPDIKPPAGKVLVAEFKAQTTLARAAGVLKAFTAIGKEAFTAVGIVGTFVGAAFVIFDFFKHNWVVAAIESVGLAAGIATGLAISGPIGWFIGGAIAAFFAILPGLFKKEKPWMKKDNFAGIIQRKMFGDAEHTGNEQCQEGTDDAPGNHNCQALYGSGKLHLALEMNNFDAIVLLIQYNKGYPMTIKDLAAAFGSDEKIANVVCHNEPRHLLVAGRTSSMQGDDPTHCVDPTFEIDRTKLKLPVINQMASEVYDRVIPNPKGDCKLGSYLGTSNFPQYAQSISGLVDAIACGVTADTDGDGV